MRPDEATARAYGEAILTAMDQSGAAVTRVVEAYLALRTPQRDRLWLMLQAGKGVNAVPRRVLQAQEAMDPLERGGSPRAFAHIVGGMGEELDPYPAYAM